MPARLYRTQVLLEPDQHRALAEISRRERRSISQVVREVVAADLLRREQEAGARRVRGLQTLERIRQHREDILAEREGKPIDFDVVEEINHMREERDEQITGGNPPW